MSHFWRILRLNNRSASFGSLKVRSDAELVKAVLDGDQEAFATLVKRYERPVRATVLHILSDYHFAADVSQEAFVAAYDKLDRLRNTEAFGPWLMEITRCCTVDVIRKRQRQNEKPLEATIEPAAEGTDGQLDEDKQRILAAVMKLSETEKQVVMLRYFSHHNVRDVAEILGRSVGTVTKQLSRAHESLRKILERPKI